MIMYTGWIRKKKGGWVADFGPLTDGWEMRSKPDHRGIRNVRVLSKGTSMLTCVRTLNHLWIISLI